MFTITAKCENGHEQNISTSCLDGEWAKQLAGLMDGTSPAYKFNPLTPGTTIGKCATCGAQFHCEVTEEKPLMTSHRFGSVGDAERMGHDAPLPGDGWVSEEEQYDRHMHTSLHRIDLDPDKVN